MFQWLLLAIAVSAIASLARGRGGHPLFFAAVAVAAFVVGAAFAEAFAPETIADPLIPWALVGLVALCARFLLGRGRAKPDSMWSCPNCHTVNESSYVVCEACQTPWAPA